MRDPRLDPYTEDVLAELMPEAQRRMRDVPVPSRVAARDEPCADPSACDLPGHGRQAAQQHDPGPRGYTAPAPPPAELGFDLAKWNRMSRAERRAVLRYARKQAPGGR